MTALAAYQFLQIILLVVGAALVCWSAIKIAFFVKEKV